jgi:AmiR/NasT family two-component response regulator
VASSRTRQRRRRLCQRSGQARCVGYITDGDGSHLQGAIDIALGRFAEYHNLEGAFGRRAVIERAKGILMERHGANDKAAFEMLRDHSQHTGRKLFDIAQAILDSHQLLSPTRVDTTGGAAGGLI